MSTARKREEHHISVEDYLSNELGSPVKHEYLGGAIYAMVGARNAHNLISTNALVAFGTRLRGKQCRPYNSDTKIRIRMSSGIRFYYPDLSVVCRPNPQSDSFQDEPALIVEVLSRNTRRVDEGEKKDAYFTIPSLCVYLLVEQETAVITAFRRGESGFVCEVYKGLDSAIELLEVGISSLPLSELYDAVEFSEEEAES
jgi:Uma2 family endonuclease